MKSSLQHTLRPSDSGSFTLQGQQQMLTVDTVWPLSNTVYHPRGCESSVVPSFFGEVSPGVSIMWWSSARILYFVYPNFSLPTTWISYIIYSPGKLAGTIQAFPQRSSKLQSTGTRNCSHLPGDFVSLLRVRGCFYIEWKCFRRLHEFSHRPPSLAPGVYRRDEVPHTPGGGTYNTFDTVCAALKGKLKG